MRKIVFMFAVMTIVAIPAVFLTGCFGGGGGTNPQTIQLATPTSFVFDGETGVFTADNIPNIPNGFNVFIGGERVGHTWNLAFLGEQLVDESSHFGWNIPVGIHSLSISAANCDDSFNTYLESDRSNEVQIEIRRHNHGGVGFFLGTNHNNLSWTPLETRFNYHVRAYIGNELVATRTPTEANNGNFPIDSFLTGTLATREGLGRLVVRATPREYEFSTFRGHPTFYISADSVGTVEVEFRNQQTAQNVRIDNNGRVQFDTPTGFNGTFSRLVDDRAILRNSWSLGDYNTIPQAVAPFVITWEGFDDVIPNPNDTSHYYVRVRTNGRITREGYVFVLHQRNYSQNIRVNVSRQLPAPTNIQKQSNTISWSAVSGAHGYLFSGVQGTYWMGNDIQVYIGDWENLLENLETEVFRIYAYNFEFVNNSWQLRISLPTVFQP